MGIQDRDYMRRPSDEDERRSSRRYASPESQAEELARNLLSKHRKVLIYAGIALGVLIVAALILASLSGGH